MTTLLRNAIVLLLLMTAVTGVAYPAVVGGLSALLFPHQAAGSLVERDGKPVGSALIGQSFTAPGYFWSRPSATTPTPNNGQRPRLRISDRPIRRWPRRRAIASSPCVTPIRATRRPYRWTW